MAVEIMTCCGALTHVYSDAGKDSIPQGANGLLHRNNLAKQHVNRSE